MAWHHQPAGGGHWWTGVHRCSADDEHRAHGPGSDPAGTADRGRTSRSGVVSRPRQAGYRLLGSRLDYLLHTRPAEWPIVAAHTTLGYLLAVGAPNAFRSERLGSGILGIALWVICLNGGTLAFNSAFDRDEGDVAYLRQPPPPPRGLAWFGLGLMLVGMIGALRLPRGYLLAYGICVLLSV